MKKRAVAVLRKGRVIGLFSSTGNAGRCMGFSDATVRNYINKETVKDGLSFRFAKDEETELIRAIGGLPKETDDTEEPELKAERKSKFTIVEYEIAFGHICITPCPFRTDNKPKVGSATCAECPFFHGRNREERQVMCSAANGNAYRKTRERAGME